MNNLPIIDSSCLDLWDRTKAILKSKVSAQIYEFWLDPIKPIGIQNQSIMLGAPDDFFKNWVIEHYFAVLEESLREASGNAVLTASFEILAVKSTVDSSGKDSAKPAISSPASFASGNFPGTTQSSGFGAGEFSWNAKYSFECFVVGPSNRFAHAASMAVAESPAKAYNPLFIYGPVGLGKTHLMQAIGQEMQKRNPQTKVLYISSEKFTNELINAIKTGTTIRFREKYRHLDCLLIDDIHFIAGKEATMEEFFHTFNALYDAHKQIVVSSDKPPKDISNLEERLVSRFEWGLVTDIQAPDYETRVAILRKKAERENIEVLDPITAFIADKVKSNIRELEGALIRVMAYSRLVGRQVDETLAHEVLKDLIVETQTKITIDYIQKRVAEYFDLNPSDLSSKSRSKNVVYPRHIAMFLSREVTGLSLPEIGDKFGGRDHTTVLHAYEKIKKDVKKDPKTKSIIDKLMLDMKK